MSKNKSDLSQGVLPLIDSIGASNIFQMFKHSWEILNGKNINSETAKEQLMNLNIVSTNYFESLKDQYNYIRVFGMPEPLPLSKIFVRINILKKLTSKIRLTPEELEKFLRYDERSWLNKNESIDAHEVTNKYDHFIVLGKPGSGKTTFLKYLTLLSLCDTQLIKKIKIPFFISLKQHAESGESFFEAITSEFKKHGLKDSQAFIRRILEDGNFRILLDGLDEVSLENQEDLLNDVIEFSKKYNKNQFIITCRIAAYNYWFDQFADVEIADFNSIQIKNFITNWFQNEVGVGEECWEKINETPQLKELAIQPLLLTLMCITYYENYDFPSSRAALYEDALDALLKKWDGSRRIKRGEVYKNLSLKLKESLLTRIAAETFILGKYFFLRRDIEKKIGDFISNLPSFHDSDTDYDSRVILKSIEAQHGILVERAHDIYSFSHLTFQEFYTARWIVENPNKVDLFSIIKENVTDDRWREVFIMLPSMLGDADDFFIYLQRVKDSLYLEDENVSLLFEKIFSVFKGEKTIVNKSLFILCAFLRIKGFAGASNYFKEITQSLIRPSKKNIKIQLSIDYVHKLGEELDYEFDDEELWRLAQSVQFSDNSIGCLNNYCKSVSILIAAINTECFVSKQIREAVFQKLF